MTPALLAPECIYFAFVVLALAVTSFAVSPSEAITEPTLLSDDGTACVIKDGELVAADPDELAKGMDMDPAACALARVIPSEASGLPRIAQIAVAWTVVNAARESGVSVLRKITRATVKDADGDRVAGAGDGYFGRQGDPVGGYRYVASSQDSTEESREIAQGVIDGDLEDPTDGAVNFDGPQSYGVQEGTSAGGADKFAANRRSEGKELVDLPGVSEDRIRFWRYA